MQVFHSQLVGVPVFSLQHGGQMTVTSGLLIDPGTLNVASLICADSKGVNTLLLPQDVRQASPQGIIVDSDVALAEPGDIVRLQPLLTKPFKLVGSRVVTQLGRKVGVVETYTVNLQDWSLEQLHVRRSFWSSPLGASLVIGKTQIVDVQDKHIVVKDTDIPGAAPVHGVMPKHS